MTSNTKENSIAELRLVLRTSRMLYNTQFKRAEKAIEHLYYLLLFSGKNSAYQGHSPWQSWIETGVDNAVREPPMIVPSSERVRVSTFFSARAVEVALDSSSAETLSQMEQLFLRIEIIRPTLRDCDPPSRLRKVVHDNWVAERLITPLTGALRAAKLNESESDVFVELTNKSLLALTDGDIVSSDVSLTSGCGSA